MPQKILITGASRGFGKETAEALVFRGHEVLAGIRGGATRGESLFSKAALRTGRLHFIDLPVDDPAALQAAPRWIDQHWQGSLDVLINNAGYGLMGPLEHQDDAQVRMQMEVNFFGPLSLTRLCLPALKKSSSAGRSPRIINVSSIAGLMSFPFYGAYNASKFALEAVSEALLYELSPFGIQIALVEPGGFKTGFNSSVEFTKVDASGDPVNAAKLESFKRTLQSKARFGADPSRVTRLMVKLSEKDRIGLRHVIGNYAVGAMILKRLLPDSWRIALEDLFFEKLFFRR
jgi:NAD(P)-dependent dehydrogenase (short-subunit alcohol dehydrogenase family)